MKLSVGIKNIISKVSKNLKWIGNDLLFSTGIVNPKLPKSGNCILVYHGIDDGNTKRVNAKFISEKDLKSQLYWLKTRANILSTEQIFNESNHDNGFNIAITFDDGFANNHKYLLPIVEELEIPITVFVTTIQLKNENYLWPDAVDLFSISGPETIKFKGENYHKRKNEYVNKHHGRLKSVITSGGYKSAKEALVLMGFDEEALQNFPSVLWRMMDASELQKLAQSPFITIGSHGVCHDSFVKLSADELQVEIVNSKKYLEDVTGNTIDQIAYPYGHYNDQIIDAIEATGYKFQFRVDLQKQHNALDKRVMTRLGINPFISWGNQVKAIGNGKY
mgnify:CR=1 FL=1